MAASASFATTSSMVPARVSHSRSRYPLLELVRSLVASGGCYKSADVSPCGVCILSGHLNF
jgi:hypothetical protein